MEKIELQSHVKGQAEEFAVRTQIFEQEIVNIKKHREIEIEEMDNRLQKVSPTRNLHVAKHSHLSKSVRDF